MFSDELMEAIVEGSPTEEQIRAAIRQGVVQLKLCPVLMGSAYKNKGVQRLLDAVPRYLPSPLDVENTGVDLSNEDAPVSLATDPQKPLVSLAFKLDDTRYGQLTYIRIYQGTMSRGTNIVNSRTKKRHKIGRLARMHASEMQDIEEAAAGDIVAFIDDDAYPDPDWITYLAATFMETDHAGVGGPNLTAPGDGPVAECVANAPGNPVHVLLSDDEAEHIAGCNMAFRKTALQAIGGFDPQFRVAGDDVDAGDVGLRTLVPLPKREVRDLVALSCEPLSEGAVPALAAADGIGV